MNPTYQSGPTRQEEDCYLLNTYYLLFDNSSALYNILLGERYDVPLTDEDTGAQIDYEDLTTANAELGF